MMPRRASAGGEGTGGLLFGVRGRGRGETCRPGGGGSHHSSSSSDGRTGEGEASCQEGASDTDAPRMKMKRGGIVMRVEERRVGHVGRAAPSGEWGMLLAIMGPRGSRSLSCNPSPLRFARGQNTLIHSPTFYLHAYIPLLVFYMHPGVRLSFSVSCYVWEAGSVTWLWAEGDGGRVR